MEPLRTRFRDLQTSEAGEVQLYPLPLPVQERKRRGRPQMEHPPPVKKTKKAGPASKTDRTPAVKPADKDADQKKSMETEQ